MSCSFLLCLSQFPPFPPSGQQAVLPFTLYLFPVRYRGRQFPSCRHTAEAFHVPHPPGAEGHHQCKRCSRGNRKQRGGNGSRRCALVTCLPHTHPSLNFIQTKHYKTTLSLQRVELLQVFRSADIFILI